MRKMRKVNGYMTVEASLVFPIVFLVLLLFLGFGMYFLNVGITKGVVQEKMELAADGALMGSNIKTGKISYGKLNSRNMLTKMFPGKKTRGTKASQTINKELKKRLILGKVTKNYVNAKALTMTINLEERLSVPGTAFLNNFGIHTMIAVEKGRYFYQGDMEQIRRWCSIYEAMD